MGKAQSKRSVDITTETKKGTEDEITEKMGKIEDLDKKDVVNGDATISEKSEHEKKDVEVVENDKDLTTEKEVVDVQASGDSADPQNAVETSKDDAGSAAAEEDISPLADESIKKSKKEKVKKKWSFRSISFGKKDKLKPSKSEEAAEEALNGADDKTNESDDTKKDNKSANENEEKTRETHENGNATPQELNGEQNGEKKPTSDDKSTANMTNTTTTTETTSESVQNETAAVSSSELSEKTENTANNETKTSENATAVNDDASKNGNGGVDEKRNVSDQQQQEPQKSGDTNATTEAASDKTSHHLASAATNESSSATTNGEVVDQIHQNGDHGESSDQQAAVIDKSKAQIEVNSNTDNNVSAATLDSLSSTSTIISPSNVQTHVQDLIKASSDEVPDEIVQINNDDPVNENSTATDKITIETIQTVDPSTVDNEIVAENLTQQQVTEVFDAPSSSSSSPSKMVDNEILLPEKLGVDSPPPPPLPISPPPSQVSVFAFTNNEDAAVQTKDFEPAIHNLIEEEKTELQQLLLPSSSSSLLNATEIDNSQEIGSIGPIECAPVDETIIIPKEPIVQEDDINKINNIEIEKCQEMKVEENKETVVVEEDETNLCKDSVVSEETPQIDETAASVAFAATVIEEITETAAEIVNQHLKCDREQITDELSAPDNNNDDDVVMNNKENIIENYIEDKTQSDIVQDDRQDEDYIDLMCEDGQKSEQITNNKKTLEECSSDLTPSNLIHQNEEIEEEEEEMNSLNKSNSLDEIHLDPTKEFATAKDIKDNVTVAEITQDLSVTCE